MNQILYMFVGLFVIVMDLVLVPIIFTIIKETWNMRNIKLTKLRMLGSQHIGQVIYTCAKVSKENRETVSNSSPMNCVWYRMSIEYGERERTGVSWQAMASQTKHVQTCLIQDLQQTAYLSLDRFSGELKQYTKKLRIKDLDEYKSFISTYPSSHRASDVRSGRFNYGRHLLRLKQEYIQIDSVIYIQGILESDASGRLKIIGNDSRSLIISNKRILLANSIYQACWLVILFLFMHFVIYNMMFGDMSKY